MIDVLVPKGAAWKDLDNGSHQGTAWEVTCFNDSAWASGPARLGYGDGDDKTVVSYGSTVLLGPKRRGSCSHWQPIRIRSAS